MTGVTRSSGITNPNYTSTHVFTNDFPALLEEVPAPDQSSEDSDLFKMERATGTCKVSIMQSFPKNKDVFVLVLLHILSSHFTIAGYVLQSQV